MKVYLGYKAYAFGMSWQAVKAFSTEDKAKTWMAEENAKVFQDQEYDDFGLVKGEEYNYFDMELE